MKTKKAEPWPVNLKIQPRNFECAQDTPDMNYVRLPLDMPAHIKVVRLIKDRGPVLELVGWTAEIDAKDFGVKVYVRISREGVLKLFYEDSDGLKKVEQWNL